jgi:hypothetical protein
VKMRRESGSSGGAPGTRSSPAEPPTADTAVFLSRLRELNPYAVVRGF